MLARCLIAALFAITSAWQGAAFASTAPPTLTVDKTFGKVAGWSIGYSKSLQGCLAAASFGDGTTLWFGSSAMRGAYIAFTNTKWRSIEVGEQYEIFMRTHQKKWRGTFMGFVRDDARGIFESGINEKFIGDFSDSASVEVFFKGRPLATLSLVGSTEALEAVAVCQKREVPGGREVASDAPSPHKLEAGMASMGTGFFVSEQGHVLTNNHVIADCSEYLVRRPGFASLEARLVARDAVNDLAVLSTDTPQKSVPPLSIRARVGESVYVYGFPQPDTLASTGNFTIGNVTATAGMRDDTRSIQISAPVHMGNSGGPVLDHFGNVVGVIQSKASAVAFGDSHDVPQNVNFAIKSAIALNFLEANNVEASIAVRKDAPMDGEGIADLSKTFVVQVVCH